MKPKPTQEKPAAHTPGPWYWKKGGNILDGSGYSVAETINDVNDEANARLISAAPDLLAVAREVLLWIEKQKMDERWEISGDKEISKAIKAAIAKAEGRK